METRKTAQFLQTVPLFSHLSEEAREKIVVRLLREEIPRGLTITRKDIPVACLYIVKSGRVQALEINEEGAEIPLAQYLPGDFFGEMSLLTGEPSAVTTRAVEDTEVYILYKMHFDEVLAENPPIDRHFIKLLSERLRKAMNQTEEAREKEVAFNRFLRQEQAFRYSQLVGPSKKMKVVSDFVERVAPNSRPVLIQGERGTGKELVARTIHQKSSRRDEPFIVVSCETLSEGAWGSELFGHEKGAIPSATSRRLGYVELAHQGTLLLKHVDRLPRHSQRLLADFLKSGEFRRIGGQELLRADVRVIATTGEDLDRMLRSGEFYGELGSALMEIAITLPLLRDHKKDVPALVDHFITKAAKSMGTEIKTVSPEAMNVLLSHDYPGNVAELESVVERAAVLASGNTIETDHIYLGLPQRDRRARVNLLKNGSVWGYFQSDIYPIAVRVLTGIFFVGIVYSLFFGNQEGQRNWGNLLVLSIFWPSLFLFCFFAARSWCAICPVGAISGLIQRFVSLRLSLPNFFRRTELWIPAFFFAFLLWFERVNAAHMFPHVTGCVILAITVGAIIMSLIFDRKVWCRYLCPLGNMCGIYAMASILEVRANADVCINECKTHECYKGGKVDGCPMFRHALFLEDNQSCRVCTNCVKNCPYRAIRINLRPPGQDLWNVQEPTAGGVFFSILLAILVFAVVIPDLPGFASAMRKILPFLPTSHMASFTGLMVIIVLVALAVSFSGGFFFGKQEKARAQFARYSSAFIPLALCGHFANHLRYVPGGKGLTLQLASSSFAVWAERSSGILISINLIWTVQIMLAILGIGWALYVMYKIYAAERPAGTQKISRIFSYHVILLGIYGAMYLWLFVSLRTIM